MTRNNHSGKVLDSRYEILSLLDEGGMGAVYLGRHIKLGRSVAVKFLHGELTGIKNLVTRFYREAQAASAIAHPNIIDVYDVGVADWGEPYLVMEYLSGENLGSLLERKGPISLSAACGIMEPALRALYAAHERQIVHRDLKPENIFLMRQENGPPVIKLIDFGISKFLQPEKTKLTRTGSLLGTPSYMSPEQARGKGTFDHRADIYSMGVVFYKMLCGSVPFIGESYNDLIVTILTEPVKKPTLTHPDFPADAEPIVMRLLEKDPRERFATCMEALEALENLPAFAQRQVALSDLTADMPEACFATGDLGGTDEFLFEIAATLHAEMGDSDAATVLERPKAKATEKAPAPLSAVSKQSRRRSERRDRRWAGLFLLLALVVAGIGISLYVTGFIPALWSQPIGTAETTTDTLPRSPMPKSSSPASAASTSSPAESSENSHSASAAAPQPEDEEAPAVMPAVVEDERNEADSKPETTTDDEETPNDDRPPETENPDTAFTEPEPEPTPEPTPEPATVPETAAASADKPGRTGATRRSANAQGRPATTSDSAAPVAPSESSAAVRPTPDDAPLSPLTPIAINRLLDAHRGRVTTCYDLARAKDPDVAGILELKVGMAGNAVDVTVTGGDVTGFLSDCIIRVIRSIPVPPNDGTLVEILKEYEFR